MYTNTKNSNNNPAPDAQTPPVATGDNKPAAPIPAPVPDKPTDEKTFTAADLEAAREKAKKDYEKELKDAQDKAQMSEEERLKADLAKITRENQMLKAEGEMTSALKTAGANEPELLFNAVQQSLEFDDKGKLANLTALVDGLKTKYPTQFGIAKPNESINGGAGTGEQPKGRSESLGDALKAHYKK